MKKEWVVAGLVLLAILIGGYWLVENVPPQAGWPILIGFTILEVVLAPIPGGAVSYIAAEQYGYWAWAILYVGNILGAAAVFWLVRRYGRPYLQRVADEKKLRKYDRLLQGHPRVLWLVYAIPLLPIDVITIAAALTNITKRRFFGIAGTALILYTGLQTLLVVQLSRYLSVLDVIGAVAAGVALLALIWVLLAWRDRRK